MYSVFKLVIQFKDTSTVEIGITAFDLRASQPAENMSETLNFTERTNCQTVMAINEASVPEKAVKSALSPL